MALFVSRRELPQLACPYPCRLTACGPTLRLCIDGQSKFEKCQRLAAGVSACVATGPCARLRIESRLEYPLTEGRSEQAYQIRVWADARLLETLEVETSAERHHRVSDGNHPLRVSRADVSYVDIPANVSQIQLESTGDVLLRISAAPGRGQSGGGPNGVFCQLDATGRQSIWETDPECFSFAMLNPLASTDIPWRIAVRSARDNRFADGGVLAWNLLRESATLHPGYDALLSRADRIRESYTYQDALVPEHVTGGLRLARGRFVRRHLRDPGVELRPKVLLESLLEDALQTISEGVFAELPAGGVATYRLPEGTPPSQLRLAIDRAALGGDVALHVQYDQRPPVLLRFESSRPGVDRLIEPSVGELALAAAHRGSARSRLRNHPIDSNREPYGECLNDVATATLNHAAGVNQVVIRNESTQDLRLAVQHLRSRQARLSERQFLFYLRQLPSETVPLANFIRER